MRVRWDDEGVKPMVIRFGVIAALLVLTLACGGSSGQQPAAPQPISPLASPAAQERPPAAATTSAVAGAAPTATRPPVSTPLIIVGTPAAGQLSGLVLQRAWEGKGYQVQRGSAGGPAAGFSAPTAEVRLVRGSSSVQLALLVYPSPQALEQEWEVKPGAAPAPKPGRQTPGIIATWWNHNVVALVRSRTGEPSADALNAFLDARP